jgi:hypothetical protein
MDEAPMPNPDPAASEALPKRPGDARSLDPVQAGVAPGSMANPSATGGCATCGQPVPAGGTAATGGCATCGQPLPGTRFTAAQGQFVYAIGRLSPQFQSPDVEKEFAQLAADVEAPEVSEHHRLKAVAEQDDNLYLAHHVCWVFTTQGIDSFAIVPRDNHDARQLVDAFAPASDETVINVVVGRPATTPPLWDWSSSGLRLVSADQLLTFTLDEFLDALDTTEGKGDKKGGSDPDHRAAMRELFFRLTRRADNQGLTDAHRALNYAALRYPALYRATLQALDDGKALMGVEARLIPSSDRRLVSVRLIFRDRHTQIVERYSCAVDVTGEFCFLAAPLSPTYD